MAEENTTNTATETPEVRTEAPASRTKRKVKRSVPHGQVHIKATFNNTIITVTDKKGNRLTASSAGACGFRGSKKGTAYAAQIASEKALTNAVNNYGVIKADVFVTGTGLGRESAIRGLQGANVNVQSITDTTGVPHGGCRPKKARRV